MPKLNYHQAALDLLQLQPEVAPKAIDRLDALEKEFDLILPPAMKEWYALKNAYRTLKKYSNGDAPVKLESMVHDFEDFYADGYMTIMVENQGVWRWALKLQRAHDLVSEAQTPLPLFEFAELHNERLDAQIPLDDPHVYVRLSQPYARWEVHAEKFSDFIYFRIWDALPASYTAFAQMNRALSNDDLAFLRTYLTERLTTYNYPRSQTFRFEGSGVRFIIWSDAIASDWHIFSDTPTGLQAALNLLEAIPGLRENFYAGTKRSEKILKAGRIS